MKQPRLAIVALALLAACANTSGTVEIPPEDLPFPVAREPSPTQTQAPSREFTVYFTQGGRLVPSMRRAGADLPVAEAAIRALIEGPTPQELSSGIATELPPSVNLLAVDIASGTATIDLGGEFQEPATPERIALRVAQVTWTLTEIPGVGEVAFAIDGEAVAVTIDDGTTVDRPVSRSDFASFTPGS
jgi:spore germination protein GerM